MAEITQTGWHYEPCGDCLRGFIPVQTERGKRYRRCNCNNGLRITFDRVPTTLMNAILYGVRNRKGVSK